MMLVGEAAAGRGYLRIFVRDNFSTTGGGPSAQPAELQKAVSKGARTTMCQDSSSPSSLDAQTHATSILPPKDQQATLSILRVVLSLNVPLVLFTVGSRTTAAARSSEASEGLVHTSSSLEQLNTSTLYKLWIFWIKGNRETAPHQP